MIGECYRGSPHFVLLVKSGIESIRLGIYSMISIPSRLQYPKPHGHHQAALSLHPMQLGSTPSSELYSPYTSATT